ncbi:MAG: SulP family inorganic anion transporter [Burkholderiaceae bacterium]
MIALMDAYRAGLLARKHLLSNIVAGLIVGVVALPLAMAFAIASGARPEQGLYTAIIAGIAVSTLGGSRVQIAGPTGAFVVILAGITAEHGIDGLQIATLMAGAILVVFGAARLGAVMRFIPAPVIAGFTAGIGVIIWVGQWREFFGLPAPEGTHFHEKLWSLLSSFGHWHPATTGLAVVSLLLVLFSARVPGLRRVPGPLVALLLVTVAHGLFGFEGVRTIGSAFGGIPQGLPQFALPELTAAKVIKLIGPAFAIAMLGAIESLLSAVVADGMAGTRHNPNQELIGQGIANIVAPLFGGFAATGAIARTATNVRNGGNSPLAGIVHSLTLVGMLLFLAPLAVDIPLATLAAVLFVVSWNMSELPKVLSMIRRAPRADVVILLVTFGLTVFADLVVAVYIGVILAVLQFMRRMASSVEVHDASSADDLPVQLERAGMTRLPQGVLVYAIDGPLFFGAVEEFERALSATRTDPHTLIIRLRWVPFIDITGLQTLERVMNHLHARGVRTILSGANDRVRGKLRRAGLVGMHGHPNLFPSLSDALLHLGTESPAGQPSLAAPSDIS